MPDLMSFEGVVSKDMHESESIIVACSKFGLIIFSKYLRLQFCIYPLRKNEMLTLFVSHQSLSTYNVDGLTHHGNMLLQTVHKQDELNTFAAIQCYYTSSIAWGTNKNMNNRS